MKPPPSPEGTAEIPVRTGFSVITERSLYLYNVRKSVLATCCKLSYGNAVLHERDSLFPVSAAMMLIGPNFAYDGLARLRQRDDATFTGETPPYEITGQTFYIYDGWRVIQERDANNTPAVSYTL